MELWAGNVEQDTHLRTGEGDTMAVRHSATPTGSSRTRQHILVTVRQSRITITHYSKHHDGITQPDYGYFDSGKLGDVNHDSSNFPLNSNRKLQPQHQSDQRKHSSDPDYSPRRDSSTPRLHLISQPHKHDSSHWLIWNGNDNSPQSLQLRRDSEPRGLGGAS